MRSQTLTVAESGAGVIVYEENNNAGGLSKS
jgi:hypothetical protein